MDNYEDSSDQFAVILQRAAQKYDVPIGIELDTQTDGHGISVRVSGASLADVLDDIVKQSPDYTWVDANGVANVMPKRDAGGVLNLRIAHFQVRNATHGDVFEAIISLPEVQAWLAQNHLTARGLFSETGPTESLPTVSLDLDDVTLREIMNDVLKQPGYSGWIFGWYGTQYKYLDISIG